VIVYLITNRLNGKRYVGQSSRTLEQRWSKHLEDVDKASHSYFHNAIRKNGADSFKLEILLTSENKDVIDLCERTLIAFYRTREKEKGYNLTDGGDSGVDYKRKT
jgi:group I intron endonuclease